MDGVSQLFKRTEKQNANAFTIHLILFVCSIALDDIELLRKHIIYIACGNKVEAACYHARFTIKGLREYTKMIGL